VGINNRCLVTTKKAVKFEVNPERRYTNPTSLQEKESRKVDNDKNAGKE